MIYDVENVEISTIEVDAKTLSRQRDTEKNLDALIASIEKIGLVQPISVYPVAYKKYRLLFGLRRLLACKKLGWREIPAAIHV